MSRGVLEGTGVLINSKKLEQGAQAFLIFISSSNHFSNKEKNVYKP
jgi:hypothetical protein